MPDQKRMIIELIQLYDGYLLLSNRPTLTTSVARRGVISNEFLADLTARNNYDRLTASCPSVRPSVCL